MPNRHLPTRTARTARTAALATAACATLIGTTLTNPQVAGADTAAPAALTGTTPGTGYHIAVTVLPASATLKVLPLGRSVTPYQLDPSALDQDGTTYTVDVDPTQIPAGYVDPGGIVTFEVTAQDPATGTMYTTMASARGVQVGTSAPAWANATASAADVPAGARTTAARTWRTTKLPSLTRVHGLGPTKVGHMTKLQHKAPLLGLRSTAQTATTAGNCVGPNPRVTKVASKLVYATLGTTYPVGKSKAFMQVSSSQGATYGAGISASGNYGTWSASGSKYSSGGWSKTWLKSSSSRSYQKQVEYYKWHYVYLDSRCNYYRWASNQETGGTTSNTGISRPDFTHCVPADPGPWTRTNSTGNAYSNSTGVHFSSSIGTNFSIERNYSTSQFVEYDVYGYQRLCGNNDWPSTAGKIMEKTK